MCCCITTWRTQRDTAAIQDCSGLNGRQLLCITCLLKKLMQFLRVCTSSYTSTHTHHRWEEHLLSSVWCFYSNWISRMEIRQLVRHNDGHRWGHWNELIVSIPQWGQNKKNNHGKSLRRIERIPMTNGRIDPIVFNMFHIHSFKCIIRILFYPQIIHPSIHPHNLALSQVEMAAFELWEILSLGNCGCCVYLNRHLYTKRKKDIRNTQTNIRV